MRITPALVLGLGTALAAPAALNAAGHDVTVPKGTSLEMKTDRTFDSEGMKKGDTFTAHVLHGLWVDGALAVPAGSTVVGEVKHVRSPKDGAKSAAVGVKFETLKIGGQSYDLEGVLVSLKADERRKIIEERAKITTGRRIDVVLIGSGTEADMKVDTLVGISGAETNDLADGWATSGLGPGRVRVAAGTSLTMELDKDITVPAAAGRRAAGDRNIYTSADTVKAVQDALKAKRYYSGEATGTLDTATRDAIARYQLDQNQLATGDADEATVRALGVTR